MSMRDWQKKILTEHGKKLSLFALMSALCSCLEPSGTQGYLAEEQRARDEQIAEEKEAARIQFTELGPTFAENCATASCHSSTGGIRPKLEFQDDFFVAVNPIIDSTSLVGPRVLAVMSASDETSMPPGGPAYIEVNPEFVALYETWVNENFDASGARIELSSP